MLPLTKTTPKPLLKVGDNSLLDRHLISLNSVAPSLTYAPKATIPKAEPVLPVVINVAYLGEQIITHLEHHSYQNLDIQISDERNCDALETAGGIINALPLIKTEFFLLINADVYTDLDFGAFWQRASKALNDQNRAAYLGLVENPSHHPNGDFYIKESGSISAPDSENSMAPKSKSDGLRNRYTFSGISAYRTDAFYKFDSGSRSMASLLRAWMAEDKVCGEKLSAQWVDVGTPERLRELNQTLV